MQKKKIKYILTKCFFTVFTMGECSLRQFKCNNDKCVQLTWMCDGEDDCGDNSDETAKECTGMSLSQ